MSVNGYITTTNKIRELVNRGDYLSLQGTDIQSGRINGYRRNVILADNTLVDTTERTIGQDVPVSTNELSVPADARILSVASTSTLDTGAGTGAQSVIIIGLDADHMPQEEVITLTGQVPADTLNTFIHINEMVVFTSGALNHNAGILYCSDSTDTFSAGGIPQNRVYDIMDINHSLSKTGLYAVSAEDHVIMKQIIINTDASITKPATVRFYRTTKKLSADTTEVLFETIYIIGVYSEETALIRELGPEDTIRITAQAGGGGSVSVSVKIHTIIY